MTTNFALSLSFDGIRLLHRVSGGWHLVGDVALESSDLAGDLANLRQLGAQLDPGDMRTKLLIPNDQIKYTAIDSTRTTEDDVKAALDGSTPYAISDLSIDFERTGGRTHIAAVARETLDEAEAFATEHGFNPVCFAAIAKPFTFASEVYFGPTKAAPSLLGDVSSLMRDDVAVMVVGNAELPPTTDVQAAPTQEPAPNEVATDEEVVFASRARPRSAETDNRTASPVTPVPEPELQLREAPAPPDDAPLFTARRDPELAQVSAPIRDIEEPASPPIAPVVESPAPTTRQSTAPLPAAPAAPRKTKSPKSSLPPVAQSGKRVGGKPRYLGLMLTAGLLVFLLLVALWANTLSEDGIAGWFRGDDAVEPVEIVETPLDPAPEVAEAEEAAPLPAQTSPTGPLPILRETTGRILSPAEADQIYAATGVYQRAPRIPLEPRFETLDRMIPAREITAAQQLPSLALPDPALMFPDPALPPQFNPPPAGTQFQRDLQGFILATSEGTVTPYGTIVFAGSPVLTPPARPGTQAPVTTLQATIDVDAPAVRLVGGPPPLLPRERPDGIAPEELAATDATNAQDVIEPTTEASEVANLDETPDLADAVAASVADAITVQTAGPEAASEPPAEASGLEDVIANFVDVITGQPPQTPPLRPAAFSSRTAPAIVTLEEPSLVDDAIDATPEALPAVVVVNPTDAVTPSGAVLASFKPSLRSANIVARVEAERAGDALLASADPALAGLRPSTRPNGLAAAIAEATQPDSTAIEEAVESTVATASSADINTVIANLASAAPQTLPASPQAIATSRRPDARPRNFATVVAQAQRAPATTQATPVRSAPAVPSGPIPGGVARAATMENAIRLRDINLIGVYGRPGDRRALIRLGNGRYVKVEVGSSLDGGQVTAIGDSALNYVKRGRTYALQLPTG